MYGIDIEAGGGEAVVNELEVVEEGAIDCRDVRPFKGVAIHLSQDFDRQQDVRYTYGVPCQLVAQAPE